MPSLVQIEVSQKLLDGVQLNLIRILFPKDGPADLVKLFPKVLVFTHPVKYLNTQQMDWPKILCRYSWLSYNVF